MGLPLPLLKNLLYLPIDFGFLQKKFSTGQMVSGKILRALSHNVFLLHVKGLNLIARSNIPLFAGDNIKAQVKIKSQQIELSLLEVNGQEIKAPLQLLRDFPLYLRLPLATELFGENGFLEIYRWQGKNEETSDDKSQPIKLKLVLQSDALATIVTLLEIWKNQLQCRLWFSSTEVYKSFEPMLPELYDVLNDGRFAAVEFETQVAPQTNWPNNKIPNEVDEQAIRNLLDLWA